MHRSLPLFLVAALLISSANAQDSSPIRAQPTAAPVQSQPAASDFDLDALTAAAEKGDSEAAVALGKAYASGQGVPADAQKAEQWLMKAISNGDQSAGNLLGTLYLETSNKGKDVERATKGLEILRAGADQDADSNITLGLLTVSGTYVPQDFDTAIAYFQKGAEMGNDTGLFYLGQMHSGELGFADKVQPAKALEYLEKSFDAGNMQAAQLLIKLLSEGTRVPKDEARAFALVGKAAEKGNASAYYILGELYQAGKGVEASPEKALESYTAGAEAGNPASQNKLGLVYGQGDLGITADKAKSEEWFQKAADQGLALAHFNLALLIDSREETTPEDDKRATAHIIAAAGSGVVDAQDRLGSWYRDGRHVTQDLVAASTWFRPAANAGNLTSKINLAQLLEATAREEEALKQALQLYVDAAKAGHPMAQFHLARLLVSGKLGRIDPITAHAYLSIASEAGLAVATEALPEIKKVLNDEQLQKAAEIKAKLKPAATTEG